MERNRTLPRDRHISQVKRLRGFLGNNVAVFIFLFFFSLGQPLIFTPETDYAPGNFSEKPEQQVAKAVHQPTTLDETDTGP